MRRILVALTVLCSVFASSVAMAQEGSTPEKVALVKRYFAAIDFEKMMGQTMKAMVPAMVAQAKKMDPDADTKTLEAAMSVSMEVTREYMPQMLDNIAKIYAESFSEDELTYLVSFYEDPRGRAITQKTAALAPKMMEAVSVAMPEMTTRMRERLCAKIDCPPANLKPVEFKPAAGQ